MSSVRVFVSDTHDQWSELTSGHEPAVRLRARDLQHAQRASRRLREDTAASVVLDLTVLIADDRRSARRLMSALASRLGSVHYVGTVDGLVGLVDDIYTLGVADGVTLIPAAPQQDVRAVGEKALRRLRLRSSAHAGDRELPVAR